AARGLRRGRVLEAGPGAVAPGRVVGRRTRLARRRRARPAARHGVIGTGSASSCATNGERASATGPAAIATIDTPGTDAATRPVASRCSPNIVTAKMLLSTGLTTAIAGSDAATCPAWNALWFNKSPTAETDKSAYSCQWPNTAKTPSSNWSTVAFVKIAVKP